MQVLPPVLRARGYGRHGDRYGVNPSKHLLVKYGSTPAFDQRAVTYWIEHKVPMIKVHLTDGRTMLADLYEFVRTAEPIEHPGHGRQLVSRDPSIWTTVDEVR